VARFYSSDRRYDGSSNLALCLNMLYELRMCRETAKLNLQVYHEKFANYITWTPEERYLDILNNRKDLISRVPQFQLASYLGVKPESLSRIRKRIASKETKSK